MQRDITQRGLLQIPPLQDLRESHRRGRKTFKSQRGWRAPEWPCESTKQDAYEFSKSETASTGPTWVCARSFVYVLLLLALYFHGTPDCENKWVSDSHTALGTVFPPPVGLCVQLSYGDSCFTLLYCILSCLTVTSYKPVLL